MNVKKFLLVSTVLLCLSFGINIGQATEKAVYFPSDSSLGFIHEPGYYVKLSVTSGNLNTSEPIIILQTYYGQFQFTSNETLNLTVTFLGVSNVNAGGDNGTENRAIQNGTVLYIFPSNNVIIDWFIDQPPWLPLMFMAGMIGLTCMFAGPITAIYKIKHGEYHDGFRTGLIFTVLGVSLFLGWLFL